MLKLSRLAGFWFIFVQMQMQTQLLLTYYEIKVRKAYDRSKLYNKCNCPFGLTSTQ
jgi:hypothetical protein